MKNRLMGAIALVLTGGFLQTAAFAIDLKTLDLEKRCGQCHDVADNALHGTENWLERLQSMGARENLGATERAEVVEFLRYHGWEVNQILAMASERHLFEEKCGLCHATERVFVRDLDREQLRATVERMRLRAPQWISPEESETIVAFLEAGARGVQRPEHRFVDDAEPAEVFRERCAGCHPLERAYLYLETELDPHWPLLVARMRAKAPEWISEAEAQQIVRYLSSLQPQLRVPVRDTAAR